MMQGKKGFFAHFLEVLEIWALKRASAPILRTREIKIFRGLVCKKSCTFSGYFHTSVKMQVRNLKFNRLKAPKHPQVSDCPEILLYSVGTISHQGAEHASAHSGRKKGELYDLHGH